MAVHAMSVFKVKVMYPILLQFNLIFFFNIDKIEICWNGQPPNKEEIHLQNKNIPDRKDHLSNIFRVISAEGGFFIMSVIKIIK